MDRTWSIRCVCGVGWGGRVLQGHDLTSHIETCRMYKKSLLSLYVAPPQAL